MTTRGQQGQQPQEPQGIRGLVESKIQEAASTIKEKLTHEGVYDQRMQEFLGLPFGLGSLYISEDKPVEFGDCLRWPESCKSGGFKNSFGNVKLGFGIPKVSFSKCEMIVMIPMGIGPITFPHISLSYRKPNCEEDPKPPDPNGENPSPSPIVQTFLIKDDYNPAEIRLNFSTIYQYSPFILNADLMSGTISDTWRAFVRTPVFVRISTQIFKDKNPVEPFDTFTTSYTFFTKPTFYEEVQIRFYLDAPGVTQPSAYPLTGTQIRRVDSVTNLETDSHLLGRIALKITTNVDIKINDNLPNFVKITSPIPHPQIKPMDDCCRKTLKLLKELHKNAAISRRPFTLPRNMIQPGAKPDKKVELRDQADDYEFLIRYLDRAIGALPIETQVEDADPDTPGNQDMLMRHESLGAALQSLIQIEFSANKEGSSGNSVNFNIDGGKPLATNELITNLLIRAMYAIGGIYKVVAQNSLELREMGEFLGYKSNEKTENLRLPFNPIAKILQQMDGGSNSLSEKQLEAFMEICPVKVSYSENEDKETIVSLFYKALTELSSIRAAFVARVKDKNEFDKTLDAALLTTQISQLVLLRDIKKALGTMKEAEFEKWFAELEKRYTEGMSPVATDNDEEFQSPIENSPRFRVVEKPRETE